MTTRVLPPEEWPKLAGTELDILSDLTDTHYAERTMTVVVVEDGDQIIACWSLQWMPHAEGLWIHPDHRQRGRALKPLYEALCAVAHDAGVESVVTGASDLVVARMLEKRGAWPFPAMAYVLPLRPGRHLTDAQLGERFHQELFAQLPSAVHDHDELHNVQVGQLMRVGLFEHQPSKALDAYNAWARQAGYETVQFVSGSVSEVVLECAGVVMAFDRQGHMQVRAVEETCQAQP